MNSSRLLKELSVMISEIKDSDLNEEVSDFDKNFGQRTAPFLIGLSSKIRKMLKFWDVKNFKIEKRIIKRGDAAIFGTIATEYDYPIDRKGNMEASGDLIISCYSYDGGKGVVCGAAIYDLDPRYPDILVEHEWKKKGKEFDASKDLLPLVAQVMKKLVAKLPDYEEYEI